MNSFRYIALDHAGVRVEGVLSAQSEQAILAELETRRLTPVSLAPERPAREARRRIPARALGDAYRQLADLLRAGVPLLKALRLIGDRRDAPALARLFREVGDGVAQGQDLAGACAERPRAFAPVHTAMIRAGEKSGKLDHVLAKLADVVIAQADLRAKLVGNLVYPCVIVVVGAGVLGVIFTVFVPKFRPLFAKIEGGTPWITRALFAISDALTRFAPISAVALGVLAAVAWRLARRQRVRDFASVWSGRLPVIGPLRRSVASLRLFQLLGTMLASGVPMLQALAIARDGVGWAPLRDTLDRAIDEVKAGKPLASPLRDSGAVDPDTAAMIEVGEAANNLPDVLARAAQALEGRIDRRLQVAVRLVEPLLLVAIALVVAFVAFGLVLPMTRLSRGM